MTAGVGPGRARPERGRGAGREVLIVDDNEDLADVLHAVLVSSGYRVRVAHDGAEGLAMLQRALPDLIVLDVEMPHLTGPELACRMLIHDAGMEEVPIVLTSGVRAFEEVAARVGTPYFLAKPYALDAILALIRRAITERRPPRPARSLDGGERRGEG